MLDAETDDVESIPLVNKSGTTSDSWGVKCVKYPLLVPFGIPLLKMENNPSNKEIVGFDTEMWDFQVSHSLLRRWQQARATEPELTELKHSLLIHTHCHRGVSRHEQLSKSWLSSSIACWYTV
jgi:hypothetical protein